MEILHSIDFVNKYDPEVGSAMLEEQARQRRNLELIPLAGISHPDIEIQDLSVKCFESWEDRRHLPTLLNLRDKTTVKWFKDYIDDVINGLNEE